MVDSYLKIDEEEKVVEVYFKLIEVDFFNVFVWNNCVLLYYKKGDYVMVI